MINIKKLRGAENLVEINGRVFITKDEFRGARPKFWIVGEKSKGGYFSYPTQNLLLKFSRNDLSLENYGEVLYWALSTTCNARCVEYQLATLEDEKGDIHHGVACPSYKNNDKQYDINGYDLMHFAYDLNATNPDTLEINTVQSYLKAIPVCTAIKPDSPLMPYLKNDLLKMAIMDYLTCQTDRHWGNISFLFQVYSNNITSFEAIKTASAYDNGCCFSLKRKAAAIQTFFNQLNRPALDGDLDTYAEKAEEISKKLQPMFGIKTSLIKIADKASPQDNPDFPKKVTHKQLPDWETTFLDELSEEIAKDPNLAQWALNMRKNFRFDHARKLIEKQFDEIPEYVYGLSEHLFTYRSEKLFNHLDKYIHKQSDSNIDTQTTQKNETSELEK